MKEFKGLYSSGGESVGPSGPTIDSRFTWVAMIDRLSGGDITKHDMIYERNYIECLNLLSYWRERDNYMKEIQKK